MPRSQPGYKVVVAKGRLGKQLITEISEGCNYDAVNGRQGHRRRPKMVSSGNCPNSLMTTKQSNTNVQK